MSMTCEILSVGTELLMGQIANTDAQVISQVLSELGINVYYHTVCGDNPMRLKNAIEIAKNRANIIITTGGLGPTFDDLTKETLAEAFSLPLEFNQRSMDEIIEAFKKMGRTPTENNKKQAYLPKGCTPFYNEWGTAPGCAFFADGIHVLMLPGPPRECINMLNHRARPYLEKLSSDLLVSKKINIVGAGESDVESKIMHIVEPLKDVTVAPYAKEGEMMLRVTVRAQSIEEGESKINPVVDQICAILGQDVYGIDAPTFEGVVLDLLKQKGLTLSTAESCTGGLISKRLTDISGSSAVFLGGVCSYANSVKESVLKVPAELLGEFGAVSKECAVAMAEGARRLTGSDIAISTTGIAGPDGGSAEKPVGLVYVALSAKDKTISQQINVTRERERVRNMASYRALDMLRRYLLSL